MVNVLLIIVVLVTFLVTELLVRRARMELDRIEGDLSKMITTIDKIKQEL